MAYMFFNMCGVKYNYILQHKYVLKYEILYTAA